MTIFSHQVSVVARHPQTGLTRMIPGWKSYRITRDMLQPADDFDMQVRFTRESWDLLALDTEIHVFIDRTKILTGFVGSREKASDKSSGTNIQITGRDKVGRLVDETSPRFKFGGLKLKALVEKIAGITDGDDLFTDVILDDSLNSRLLAGKRARQARVVRIPVISPIAGTFRSFARDVGILRETEKPVQRPFIIEPGILEGRAIQRKVKPGTKRWAVLELFLKEARLLAWSTADGRSIFVGLPNYEQDPQYNFFEAAEESSLRDRSNAMITIKENIEELYSKIECVGSLSGSNDEFGDKRTRKRFTVYDNPENTKDGTGIRFQRRKELIFSDDSVRSIDSIKERAEREQLEREVDWHEAIVDVPGHSQIYKTGQPAIYTTNKMCFLNDESTGTKGHYIITSCEFTNDRSSGTRTIMRTVPRGTLLTL